MCCGTKEAIDPGIVDLVKLLNEKGFITDFSCSGLYKEHLGYGAEYDDPVPWGYISFPALSVEQKNILIDLCKKFYLGWEEGSSTNNVIRNMINKECVVGRKKEEVTNDMLDEMVSCRWKMLYDFFV